MPPNPPTITGWSIAGEILTVSVTVDDQSLTIKAWLLHGGIGGDNNETELAGSRVGDGDIEIDLTLFCANIEYLGTTFYEPVQIVCQAFDAGGVASVLSNLILPTLTTNTTGVELTGISREPDPSILTFTLTNPNGHKVLLKWSQAGVFHDAVFTGEGTKSIANLYPVSVTFVITVVLTTHQIIILGIHEAPVYQILDKQVPHIVGQS